ncbi:MAG: hypothetical protein ABI895_29125 [Deltaproteobacteria bacterium]
MRQGGVVALVIADMNDALARVEDADRLDVDLERNNQPLHLTYHIVSSLTEPAGEVAPVSPR